MMPTQLLAKIERRIAAVIPFKPRVCQLPFPIVSITFDDFPRSAWTAGGALLNERGIHGTYYLCGGLVASTWEGIEIAARSDISALVGCGHELGSHTFGHARLQRFRAASIKNEIDRNAMAIREIVPGYTARTFAYPYGEAGLVAKRIAAGRFLAARGIKPGVNRGLIDFSQLHACSLDHGSYRVTDLETLLEQAVSQRGWLILYTHDVSYNCG